jgi:two-component system chemotaxis response regulator CheY
MWNVLIVDDDFYSRKLIQETLKSKAVCDMAVNGEEALRAVRMSFDDDTPYDVVLLDIAMPGMDGISFLEKLRAIEFEMGIVLGDGVPVIMITAYEKPFLTAFNKGCDDYLLKPIDPDELLKRIQTHVEC